MSKSQQHSALAGRAAGRRRYRDCIEALEPRMLFSGTIYVTGGLVNGELSSTNEILPGQTAATLSNNTDFGPTDLNDVTTSRQFDIINTDASNALTLTGSPLVGISGDTSDFSITVQPGESSLPAVANGSYSYISFTVAFKPTTVGEHNATITIANTDTTAPSFTFVVGGQGVPGSFSPISGYATTEMTDVAGSGAGATANANYSINYTGYLADGTVFDSSYYTGRTPLQVGNISLITGFTQGLIGIKPGETRTLIIPASEGYGSSAQTGIPANSTLYFAISRPATVGANYVSDLYAAILGRAADSNGLSYWNSELTTYGMTPTQVSTQFVDSTEYRTNQIDNFYATILGRNPDSTGVNYWLNQLANGTSLEEVQSNFYGSSEFAAAHGNTVNGEISGLYNVLLGRSVDSTGLQTWTNYVASGHTISDVAYAIITAPEGEQTSVTLLYETYLHRQPDSGGLSYWTSVLAEGYSETDVLIGITAAPEYYNS
jgi:hypothetical protein